MQLVGGVNTAIVYLKYLSFSSSKFCRIFLHYKCSAVIIPHLDGAERSEAKDQRRKIIFDLACFCGSKVFSRQMFSDIHIQKALLAPRKSHSQLFHPFAELLEFQKKLKQEALMQEGSYPWWLPPPRVIGGVWPSKDRVSVLAVSFLPHFSSLLSAVAVGSNLQFLAEPSLYHCSLTLADADSL